jgi:hypothetical protein
MSERQKVDANLAEQLGSAAESVQAVCHIRMPSSDHLPSAEETQSIAEAVLERVGQQTKMSPLRIKVFRNLASFSIEASPEFIRALADQDEVRSLQANQRASMSIMPPTPPSQPLK